MSVMLLTAVESSHRRLTSWLFCRLASYSATWQSLAYEASHWPVGYCGGSVLLDQQFQMCELCHFHRLLLLNLLVAHGSFGPGSRFLPLSCGCGCLQMPSISGLQWLLHLLASTGGIRQPIVLGCCVVPVLFVRHAECAFLLCWTAAVCQACCSQTHCTSFAAGSVLSFSVEQEL